MWLEFLSGQRTGWREAGVEQVARFAAWLRAPAANVIVLDAGESARTAATVNRHLAAVFGFYDFHARAGVGLAADLVAWRRVGRGQVLVHDVYQVLTGLRGRHVLSSVSLTHSRCLRRVRSTVTSGEPGGAR